MVKIQLILPNESKREKEYFENLIRKIPKDNIEIESFHIFGTTDLRILSSDADIIVAHGITFHAIQQIFPKKHLIEITTNGFDILSAISQAKKNWPEQKIALCMHNEFLRKEYDPQTLFGNAVHFFDVKNEDDIEKAIQEGLACGIKVFVGGLTLGHRCEQLGLHFAHIKAGYPVIERALREAIYTATTINQERTKSSLIQSVLNNIPDAVLVLNKQGGIIAVNNQAKYMMGMAEIKDFSDKNIYRIVPEISWKKVLESPEESEHLQSYKGKLYLISSKPILLNQKNAARLLSIQNADLIAAKETKIRRELSAKGLTAKYTFENIIGESEALKYDIEIARKYTQVDSNILLVGETGTGKELFAHSIHNASRRHNQPFVSVNCAALPENLLESELFGYVEGAFSGAIKGGKIGLFEQAHKGTIFLDEIGELPIDLQAKLLRVLQEKEIRRVGDTHIHTIDVRVISATNIDLKTKIAEKKFRADLYYRLNLLSIEIPPLRERKEDIPYLTRYFLNTIACEQKRDPPQLDKQAQNLLTSYSWLGNARELRNFCERLMVLCDKPVVSKEDIAKIWNFEEKSEKQETSDSSKEDLYQLLLQNHMKKEEVAKLLGISRTTLWRRLKQNETEK